MMDKDLVVRLIKEGKPYSEINKLTGLSRSSISRYNIEYAHVFKKHGRHIDWQEIQEAYNQGLSRAECLEKFNITRSRWYQAIGRGSLKRRPEDIEKPMNIYKLLIRNSSHGRHNIKTRLIKNGLLKNECYVCGQQPVWVGSQLVMVLDHINGISNDYRIENLRLLCPNCNSQTQTFAGRRKKYKITTN